MGKNSILKSKRKAETLQKERTKKRAENTGFFARMTRIEVINDRLEKIQKDRKKIDIKDYGFYTFLGSFTP